MNSEAKGNQLNSRIIGLDILRSMAILFVLYNHSLIILRGNGFLFFKPLIFDGVNLFFVLSGFLIGKIIFNTFEKNLSFKSLVNFWLFRALKIIPSYILVLFCVIIFSRITQLSMDSFSIKYFFFSQNLLESHPDFFKEAWSLSVEEWFYFTFPLLFFILAKVFKNLKWSAFICVSVFIIFSFTLRVVHFESNDLIHSFSEFYRKIVVFRFDSIMFGVLFFLLSVQFEKYWIKFRKQLLLIGLGLLFILEFQKQLSIQVYFPFLFLIESFSIALLLPFFSQVKRLNLTIFDKKFNYNSILSYSLYLVNLSLIQLFIFPFAKKYLDSIFDFSNSLILAFTLYLLLVLLSAFCLYFFIEKPFINLRNKLFAERSR